MQSTPAALWCFNIPAGAMEKHSDLMKGHRYDTADNDLLPWLNRNSFQTAWNQLHSEGGYKDVF